VALHDPEIPERQKRCNAHRARFDRAAVCCRLYRRPRRNGLELVGQSRLGIIGCPSCWPVPGTRRSAHPDHVAEYDEYCAGERVEVDAESPGSTCAWPPSQGCASAGAGGGLGRRRRSGGGHPVRIPEAPTAVQRVESCRSLERTSPGPSLAAAVVVQIAGDVHQDSAPLAASRLHRRGVLARPKFRACAAGRPRPSGPPKAGIGPPRTRTVRSFPPGAKAPKQSWSSRNSDKLRQTILRSA